MVLFSLGLLTHSSLSCVISGRLDLLFELKFRHRERNSDCMQSADKEMEGDTIDDKQEGAIGGVHDSGSESYVIQDPCCVRIAGRQSKQEDDRNLRLYDGQMGALWDAAA
ncbi:hypothetical protein GOP47_0029643 [Adiantum capillus-veneris]|nr:hypothetical protein GOP47_0029643 [Adiantum capillus-veneris]